MRRTLRISVALATVLGLLGGTTAFAQFSWLDNVSATYSTLVLGSVPGTPSTSTTDACATVDVSWSAATNANSYRVQVRTANGAWSNVDPETGNVTDITDGGYTNRTVTHRVFSRINGSAWESTTAATSNPLVCGIGEVSDLDVTNECNANDLTWSAAGGASSYDIWRSIDGGAFTEIVTNLAGTSYSDTTATEGKSAAYYVVPGDGGTNGHQSNTATNPAFSVFKVSSITITNGGSAGSVDAGDTVAVTFSKAADASTPSGTDNDSIYIKTDQGDRGLYLAAAAPAAGSAGIGGQAFSGDITGTNQAFAGSTGWSAGDTVWTWTRGAGAGVAESAPGWGTFAEGTSGAAPARVRCVDSVSTLSSSAPTVSGWF